MTSPDLDVLSSEIVEQAIDGGERGHFLKQVLRAGGPGAVPLGLVRKVLPGGEAIGRVLLVHGFAQNRYSWHTSRRSVVNWLAARGWDTYNLELRGHGRSRPGATGGAERFADYVDDVARVAESLGAPFLMGHSLGGAACYGAATLTPVAGVVGIGALFGFAQHNRLLRTLGVLSLELARSPLLPAFALRTQLLGRLLARLYAVSDIAGYTVPISGWWPGSIEQELLDERLSRGFDWTSAEVWLEMSRWARSGGFDYEEAWRRTEVPLLVIAGDRDHLCPPGDARRAYDSSGSSDRTWVLLDDYHHEVHWGHLDLVLGRLAPAYTWSIAESWMRERLGDQGSKR